MVSRKIIFIHNGKNKLVEVDYHTGGVSEEITVLWDEKIDGSLPQEYLDNYKGLKKINGNFLIDQDMIDTIATSTALDLCYQNRRLAYGDWGNQLDEIYHDQDAWKIRIAAVKAQFPKPS